MPLRNALLCSSHTISGTMPGGPVPARHGFRERVSACAAAGFAGLCLHVGDYRDLRERGWSDEALRSVLQEHGMHDVGLEFLTDWFLEGTEAEAARDDERTAYAAARAYGAHLINVGSDFRGRGLPRHVLRSRFRALCERAGEKGLAIALEVVPWSDVPTLEVALEVIEGLENAGLVIDAWHMFRGGIPLDRIAALPGERILSVQINDALAEAEGTLADDTRRRMPCGNGCFDLAGFLEALDKAGTTVAPSVEIISPSLAALPVEEAARLAHDGARRLLDRHLDPRSAR